MSRIQEGAQVAVVSLGDLAIDPASGRVSNGNRLKPRAMDVLAYLCAEAPRVVSSDELLDRFWPGRIVDGSTIHRRINQIRKALGDDARRPRYVETVPKRGYRIVATVGAARSEPPTEPATTQPPFVGRDDVLASLTRALARARAGAGSVCLLSGPAGIGKTRTINEFLAASATPRVHAGWCDEIVATAPYWPWKAVIASLVQSGRVDRHQTALAQELRALAEIAPWLVERFPDLPELPELEPAAGRVRLFEAMAALLKRLATDETLVLSIDDLHRADRSSLSLLDFVARAIEADRVLILGTYRNVEIDRGHPLTKTLSGLVRRPGFDHAELRALSMSEVTRLARWFAPEIPDDVVARADGNPLYAILLARAAAVDPERDMPTGLREAIVGGLAGLSQASWQAISAAAVIGREFEPALVGELSSLAESSAQVALGEARKAGVLEDRQDRFAHVLVRDAVYHEIPAEHRRSLHERCAHALAARPRDRIELTDMLRVAHHFAESRRHIDAARWYQRAHAELQDLGDRQAYDCCRQALEGLEVSARSDVETATWIVRTAINAIHCAACEGVTRDEVEALFRRSRAIAGRLPGSSLSCLLYTVYSDYLALSGEATLALEPAEEASALAEGLDDATRLHVSITLIGRYENCGRRGDAFTAALREIDRPPADPLASLVGEAWHPYPRILASAAEHEACLGDPRAALARVQTALDLLRLDGREVEPAALDLRRDLGRYRGVAQAVLECVIAGARCYFYMRDLARLTQCAEHLGDWLRDHYSVVAHRADLSRGQVYWLSGDWSALADFGDGNGEMPAYKRLRALRAEALARLGRHAAATSVVLNLLEDESDDPATLVGCARALEFLPSADMRHLRRNVLLRAQREIDRQGAEGDRSFLLEVG